MINRPQKAREHKTMAESIKKQIHELEGAQLDWAVAIAVGGKPDPDDRSCMWMQDGVPTSISQGGHANGYGFNPSTNWAIAGPLVEKYWVKMQRFLCWNLGRDWPDTLRSGHLTWFMRAVVSANTEGLTVQVPAEPASQGVQQ